jgi:NADH dehydrogenase
VHLVAIIAGTRSDFERVMVAGTRSVVEAARDGGVRRLVLMSALGTSAETSTAVPYYAAKWAEEQTVRSSGLAHAILRPSFVFGTDGGALPRLVRVAALSPVTLVLGSGAQRLQPIWVDDLARAAALAAVAGDDTLVELGGPNAVDWNGLWAGLQEALGTRRPALRVPLWLLRPPVGLLERLPRAPLTRDQLRMLELGDNVVGDGGAGQRALGLGALVPLREQLERAVHAYRTS